MTIIDMMIERWYLHEAEKFHILFYLIIPFSLRKFLTLSSYGWRSNPNCFDTKKKIKSIQKHLDLLS